MFNFLDMFNYDSRAVARYEDPNFIVDTTWVSGGFQPIETAVSHREYCGGDWVIVEAYDTEGEARTGHERWIRTMSSEPLPCWLVDCCNSPASRLLAEMSGGTLIFQRSGLNRRAKEIEP